MINVSMADKNGVTLATAGKYCSQNVKVTPSADILRKDEQEKSATPSTSSQDITPDAGMALSKVTVNPITPAIVGGLDAKTFAAASAAAIEGKGVTVPDGTMLDGMAALIESIEAGGGGEVNVSTGSFTPVETTINLTIQHNLGKIPKAVFLWVTERTSWGSDSYSVLFAYAYELSAGGIPTVISTGIYSKDDHKSKFLNANISYAAGYGENKTLETFIGHAANNVIKVYGATTDSFNVKYEINGGGLKGGWTYQWLAI